MKYVFHYNCSWRSRIRMLLNFHWFQLSDDPPWNLKHAWLASTGVPMTPYISLWHFITAECHGHGNSPGEANVEEVWHVCSLQMGGAFETMDVLHSTSVLLVYVSQMSWGNVNAYGTINHAYMVFARSQNCLFPYYSCIGESRGSRTHVLWQYDIRERIVLFLANYCWKANQDASRVQRSKRAV